MKKITLLLIVIISSVSFGQSFEGKLTYKVEFKINMEGVSESDMIAHMKKSGDYFDTVVVNIKGGNYEKLINSANSKRVVYKSEVNKVYNFDDSIEFVIIGNAKNYNASSIIKTEKPEIIQNDSLVSIMNKDCKSITLDWGNFGKEIYYYNENFIKIDPELFKSHNLEYLNSILDISKSYPTQIIKSVNKFIEIKMTLIAYSEEEISDTAFEIPELEPAEKEFTAIIKETTGSDVMQIKK